MKTLRSLCRCYSDNGRAYGRLRRHGRLRSGLQAGHTRLPALPRSQPLRGRQVDDTARTAAEAGERKEGKHLRSLEQAATCKNRPAHDSALERIERGRPY